MDAAGASFRDASLYKSDFSHSNLVNAVFDGADVSEANFAHSNLRGASFVGAHGLETADFTDARLPGGTKTSYFPAALG